MREADTHIPKKSQSCNHCHRHCYKVLTEVVEYFLTQDQILGLWGFFGSSGTFGSFCSSESFKEIMKYLLLIK